MAATPLDPTSRYIHPGTLKVYWMLACADVDAPTRAEMDAGVDLTNEIADMSGWDVTSALQPVPDGGTRFTARVPGRIEPGDAQIMFWGDKTTADIRTVLHRDDTGFIMIMLGGDVPTQAGDVYPVQVSMVSKPPNITGDPGQITVGFAINQSPGEDVAIPA